MRRRDTQLRWAHPIDNAGYAALFASAGLPYLGGRVTYGVWALGNFNARRVNNGRPDRWGNVNWDPRSNPKYAFNDPDMMIAVNKTRWLRALDLLDSMVQSLAAS